MSTPTGPAANGRARKSLEHQLGRFDSILDGLADALNESVADAVRDAVGQAVRDAVRGVAAELAANPGVARALAAHGLTPPAEPPAAPRGPSLRERLAARWHRLRTGAVDAKDRAVGAVSERLRTTRTVLTAAVRLARADRRGVTLAALAGVVVGVGCHLCGPAAAATVGGVTSAVLALVGRLLRPLYPVMPLLASARAADRPDGAD